MGVEYCIVKMGRVVIISEAPVGWDARLRFGSTRTYTPAIEPKLYV
jgi:hypothetical protein